MLHDFVSEVTGSYCDERTLSPKKFCRKFFTELLVESVTRVERLQTRPYVKRVAGERGGSRSSRQVRGVRQVEKCSDLFTGPRRLIEVKYRD